VQYPTNALLTEINIDDVVDDDDIRLSYLANTYIQTEYLPTCSDSYSYDCVQCTTVVSVPGKWSNNSDFAFLQDNLPSYISSPFRQYISYNIKCQQI